MQNLCFSFSAAFPAQHQCSSCAETRSTHSPVFSHLSCRADWFLLDSRTVRHAAIGLFCCGVSVYLTGKCWSPPTPCAVNAPELLSFSVSTGFVLQMALPAHPHSVKLLFLVSSLRQGSPA